MFIIYLFFYASAFPMLVLNKPLPSWSLNQACARPWLPPWAGSLSWSQACGTLRYYSVLVWRSHALHPQHASPGWFLKPGKRYKLYRGGAAESAARDAVVQAAACMEQSSKDGRGHGGRGGRDKSGGHGSGSKGGLGSGGSERTDTNGSRDDFGAGVHAHGSKGALGGGASMGPVGSGGGAERADGSSGGGSGHGGGAAAKGVPRVPHGRRHALTRRLAQVASAGCILGPLGSARMMRARLRRQARSAHQHE